MTPELRIECAWCGDVLQRRQTAGEDGDAVSHGLCISCLGGLLDMPVMDLNSLTEGEVNRLPFGWLELTRMGVVRRYNRTESDLSGLDPDRVRGKDFFREVAPCTQATEFEARWRDLIRNGGGDADFEFVFKFESGHRLVRIRMLVDPDLDQHLLLVQDLEAGDDADNEVAAAS